MSGTDKAYGVWVDGDLLPTGPQTREEAERLVGEMKGEWPGADVAMDVHPDKIGEVRYE